MTTEPLKNESLPDVPVSVADAATNEPAATISSATDAAGFCILPDSVACRTDITPGAKLVFAMLLRRIGRKAVASVGEADLGNACGLRKATVSDAIRRLRDVNLIGDGSNDAPIIEEPRAKGKRGRYRLGRKPCFSVTESVSVPLRKPQHTDTKTVSQPLRKAEHIDTKKHSLEKKQSAGVSIPENLSQMPGFSEAWAEWLKYRRERRLTTTPTTLRKQLAMLAGQPNPIAVIERSIQNGWQGLFPDKTPTTKPTATAEAKTYDW